MRETKEEILADAIEVAIKSQNDIVWLKAIIGLQSVLNIALIVAISLMLWWM